VLKPKDIENAFNAGYIKQKLRGQKVTLPSGELVTTDVSNAQFSIPKAGRVSLSADVMIIEQVETHHIDLSARPELVDDGFSVVLKAVEIDEEKNDSLELTQTLIENTQSLLNLRFFELEGMSLQFEQITVEANRIVIGAVAEVTSFAATPPAEGKLAVWMETRDLVPHGNREGGVSVCTLRDVRLNNVPITTTIAALGSALLCPYVGG